MADKLFKLEIISPDRIFYKGDITMLELSTTEGDIGIYADHIPMTSILTPGKAIITEQSNKKELALHSGFIEILGDKVTIMAESVEWPEEIDLNRAKEAKVRAERRISGNNEEVNVLRAEMALKRSLVRINLAEGRR